MIWSISVKSFEARMRIGLLTTTFNGMIVGFRERLHLMKYVGTHTIDMIRNHLTRKYH